MIRTPWWGTELYSPEILQKPAYLLVSFSGIRAPWWRTLLAKRKLLITALMCNILLTLFLLSMIVLLLYMSLVIQRAHESQWGVPFIASLLFSAIAYSEIHSTIYLYYFLFVDKRDIERVLQRQIDYGVQHNIWP